MKRMYGCEDILSCVTFKFKKTRTSPKRSQWGDNWDSAFMVFAVPSLQNNTYTACNAFNL